MNRHRLFACVLLSFAIVAPIRADQPSASKGVLFGQPITEFAARRAALRDMVKDAVILICGPGEDSDISITRFRTDNSLMYLTGVEVPGACLALLPEGDPSGKREMLFLPRRAGGVWTDRQLTPGPETAELLGVEATGPSDQLWSQLKPSIEKAGAVKLTGRVGGASGNLPGGGGISQAARFYPNGSAEEAVKGIDAKITVEGGVERYVNKLRWKKSPGEVSNLRAAIAATGNAEAAAARTIRDGVPELSVEGVILAEFRAGGAVREGFPSIVGSGPNSTILHHFSSDRIMRNGEVVVVDIGAEYNYYSADITRTFPVGGKFSPRQRELYQLVLDTQKAAEKYVKPGETTLRELNGYASQYLRNSPLRAKDSRGNLRTMDTFFVHGLGHWLGMNVHDVSGGSSVLMPGTVFTIEPGVYIQSEGIGFRIEDDYLVTEAGVEKLSKAIPSEVGEIEALMRPKPVVQPSRGKKVSRAFGTSSSGQSSRQTHPARKDRPVSVTAVPRTGPNLRRNR